ncbi:MAG: hypothetical protein MUF13_13095 [Akkermansiaceae bacterium]|nr:hypothetical protein [Akkermansiaceae bacterium]
MKKLLRHWKAVALGAAAALTFSSCAYDPYYSSVGGSYSTGYGDGYGYGGSNFSTSVFVSTGDARWGYDPYCYSYYDYHRRAYYDPYLNGYYPIGYRPPVVVGVPHPYGWRPGGGYCPPPRYIRNTTVVNYRNREDLYRRTNYDWAPQVRKGQYSAGVPDRRPGGNVSNQRPTNTRPSMNQGGSQRPQSQNRPSGGFQTDTRPGAGNQNARPSNRQQGRLPQSYNTPVNRQDNRQMRPAQRGGGNQNARPQPQQRQAPRQEERRPVDNGPRMRNAGRA